jgi:hypothetical protein
VEAILLSTAYLPPIGYVSRLVTASKIIFEKHEHYVKQTYQSRALTYGANGLHPLIVPVQHDDLYIKPVSEIRISYDSPWQKIHWRTITSAYRNSPFFEYFEDELRPFFETKRETLFEFNFTLLQKLVSLLQIPFKHGFTAAYERTTPESCLDLRNAFTPAGRNTTHPAYKQVFSDRHGFISDLSVIDLLFNKGMEAKAYLEALAGLPE